MYPIFSSLKYCRISAIQRPKAIIDRGTWTAFLLMTAATLLFAQIQQPSSAGSPHDWSTHHLVFSAPKDATRAAQLEQEPRYEHQQAYRKQVATGATDVTSNLPALDQLNEEAGLTNADGTTPGSLSEMHAALKVKKKAKGLWGESLNSATATVGAGNYPAKYSFNGGVNCADFVAFNTSVAGNSGQASIVAYDNLYSGTCTTGTVPQAYWAYNTGGTISRSVVLSNNGSQVAFIHTPSSGAASLVILHWHAGDGTITVPTSLTSQTSGSAYQSCRSSTSQACMFAIAFGNGKNDTNSSPFYDYLDDVLYVGDNSGNLHKFTGIFSGSPAEVTGGNWPAAVSSNVLTSAVYDATSTHIFVADAGGFVYSYTAAGALNGKSSQLAVTGSKGIVDGPIVDSSAETVYVFVGDDENTVTNHNCDNATGCNGAFQFSVSALNSSGSGLCASNNGTSWTTGTNCGSESVFGVGNASTVLYDGTFDNTYYSGTGTTGNLWTCAATGTPVPKLDVSPISSFGSALSIATNAINPLASAAATCSPVTEVENGSDYIFLSVTASGNQTGCTGACVYSFTLANETTSPTAAVSAGINAAGGASGIIIDNTGTGGGSQIYFTYLSQATSSVKCPAPSSASSGGCAVQASQSALK